MEPFLVLVVQQGAFKDCKITFLVAQLDVSITQREVQAGVFRELIDG